jgi:Tol biopolymer transport system component
MRINPHFTGTVAAAALVLALLFMALAPAAVALGQTLPAPGVLAFSTPTDPRSEWAILLLDVRTRVLHQAGRYGWRIALPLEWSPDGSRLAYATVSAPSDIFIHEVYTGRTFNLTRSFADDRYPTWSPDGARLLFFSNQTGLFEIYSIAADGSDLTRLTADEGILPAFSPDGSQIVFTATGHRNLYLMDADGSRPRPITRGLRNDRNASWSPDGQQIAFVGLPRGQGHYIYLMNTACLGQTHCEPVLGYPGFRFQGMPHWSPDGRWLAFVGQTPQDSADALYVIDRQGDNLPRKLADDVFYAYAERWSMWSPDSRYVAFARRQRPGLFMAEVATGQIEQLARLAAVYPVWQPQASAPPLVSSRPSKGCCGPDERPLSRRSEVQ